MYQVPDTPTKGIEPDLATYGLPRIILFDEKRWRYIQRRYHMTPRELQVAKLICRGLDNEGIATNLRIKPGTIKTHLRNIYRRVRVKNKLTMLLVFLHDIDRKSNQPLSISKVNPVNKNKKSK